MKKLTAAQKKVLNEIKETIREAKSCNTFGEYYNKHYAPRCNGRFDTYEKALKNYKDNTLKIYEEDWVDELNNIVLTHCASSTLRVLEREGYIKIIKDSANECYGIDRVELLKELD